MLQPAETGCAGRGRFDHLLGFSLLVSGYPAEASWVLERAAAANPNSGAAWLDLADAYLQTGDTLRADTALQHARALQPPPVAQRKIDTLQAALDKIRHPWSLSYTVRQEIGWDSNVNSATDQLSIVAPGFSPLPIKLDPDARASASSYADLELGGALTGALNDDWTFYLLPRVKTRHYEPLRQFDRTFYNLQSGVSRRVGSGLLLGMLQGEQQQMAGRDYLRSEGGILEWRQPVGRSALLSLTSQYTSTRYADRSMRNYDSNVALAGLAWKQGWTPQVNWSVAAYRGEDDGVNNRAGGGRRMVILSGALNVKWLAGLESALTLTHESDDYRQKDPAFLVTRSESIWNYTASLSWPWNKHFSSTVSYSHIRDDANIVLYGSKRDLVSLSVRGDF
ncbi:tetratricopeptide repeat protein [Paludibacterium sp. THUN1379]|uniref:surface lipoprotein assembly modifier n=1 Tax=Paludibacterium sp. THUN1379 TaxID=3112107 RepID=UPI0030CC446A